MRTRLRRSVAGRSDSRRGATAARPLGLQDCTSQIDSGAFQYITTIDDRRVEIADTVTGLAIGLSHFRHPMTQKKFKITGNPGRERPT